ncbi:SDR family NAD(P)-dependent oxidoreductase [Promicromonospora sp. MS192]|uniref:SDR family NAD(P)-dependent oxidoreductase n=1 Tax=Promicromonospora sp. MS192 TaxID=3412684 RepID=UPI003C2EB05F
MHTTWFITGASRGLGREWAEAALDRGDHVAATARDVRALEPLSQAYGDAFVPIALDVTDRAAVLGAVEHAVERMGCLDVVVNNAGYGDPPGHQRGGRPGLRVSAEHPDYAEVRVATAPEFALGDPRATRDALLRITDAPEPPLHVFLGKPLADVEQIYADRLRTWRAWEPVAQEAFGA